MILQDFLIMFTLDSNLAKLSSDVNLNDGMKPSRIKMLHEPSSESLNSSSLTGYLPMSQKVGETQNRQFS